MKGGEELSVGPGRVSDESCEDRAIRRDRLMMFIRSEHRERLPPLLERNGGLLMPIGFRRRTGCDDGGGGFDAPDVGLPADGCDSIASEFPDIEAVHAKSIAPTWRAVLRPRW